MTDIPKIPFTQAGFEKIKVEDTNLQKKRAEILIRLQLAREMGDLSENGAYKAARFELSDTDRRLRQLQYQLRFGFVSKKTLNNTISFGCQVTLDHNGEAITYMLVNQYESNPSAHKLSIESPLGQLLMGKKVGDTVNLLLPSGNQIYQIKAIS